MSLLQPTQNRLLQDMIGHVGADGDSADWKLLMVDKRSMRVISSACRMYDVMQMGISAVEDVMIKRQPLPKIDAIYFLSPCEESVNAMIGDFADKKKPLYNNVHLFFTSRLSEELFKAIQKARVRRRIKTFRELNVDYLAFESQAFQFDSLESMKSLFAAPGGQEEINRIAERLVTVCTTMGELPYIRSGTSPVASSLASAVNKKLRDLSPDARGQLNKGGDRALLLILDRTFDPVSPLLHEFTYQAMIYDLLPITDDNVYEYTFDNGGDEVVKKVLLDEHDFLWPKLRHLHIADCINRVIEDFNTFIKTNKAVKLNRGRKELTSLKQMTEAMKEMPQYQEMFAKYALHIRMAGDCMDKYNGTELEKIALIEQDLATGKGPRGESISKVFNSVQEILRDPSVGPNDKMRLALLYLACYKDARSSDKDKMIEAAGFRGKEVELMESMAALGVSSKRRKPHRKEAKLDEDDQPYQVSRYTPLVKDLIEGIMEGELNEDDYPYSGEAAREGYGQKAAPAKQAKSLKTTSRKKGKDKGEPIEKERPSGPKVVVFIAGGMCFSEVRAAYEVMRAYNREVVIGATNILTPTKLFEEVHTRIK
eukprot:TRINITY_DN2751_c0_g1_i1.p1 TRINITY_DN2751_c0_g1~~TRINITY_DN2751_c0_g1_i1.p1  ORF type:complete len:596 (+),score=98.55 TRINITY_DN2751_c0_g1_i1:112-1899(+)